MGRNQIKDSDASVPERRSTRHSKNSGEAVKSCSTVESGSSVGKEKENKNKNKEITDTERKSEKDHKKKRVADKNALNNKPTTSKSSTKKRVMTISDEDDEDDPTELSDMNVESSVDNIENEANDQDKESEEIGMEKAKKKRKHGTTQSVYQVTRPRPLKTSKIVKQFTMCTYCGENLSEHLKQGEKVNLKRHFALKHAAALCREMGSGEGPVCSKAFMKHLDCVDQVYQSLKSHGYKIIPACNFFNCLGSTWTISEVCESEKEPYFKAFNSEATKVFNLYQVVYLKGITVPTSFNDLLKEEETNYDSVKWVSEKPSANNFSLKSYRLSEEESIAHSEEIKDKLSRAVSEWSVRFEEMWK